MFIIGCIYPLITYKNSIAWIIGFTSYDPPPGKLESSSVHRESTAVHHTIIIYLRSARGIFLEIYTERKITRDTTNHKKSQTYFPPQ